MKAKIYIPIILTVIVIIVVWWWYCFSITTIILVRHADRDGDTDALNAIGTVRAVQLQQVAEKAGVTAIYHSMANRTRMTVEPLANALGIAMIEEGSTANTINDIFSNHRGETVIVAGHSNTVPEMIELAGGPTGLTIDHNEYDNLFVLTKCHCWYTNTKLVNLQYGVPSP